MGVHRYGISLWVSNSIAQKWVPQLNGHQVEHKKRNSISTSNYVLFCLSYINTIALYWQEKAT